MGAPSLPLVTRDYLLHHRVCPGILDNTIVIYTGPDYLPEAIAELSAACGHAVGVHPITDDELDRRIQHFTTAAGASLEVTHPHSDADDFTTDIRDLANQPPVVRYVNLLIRDAYDATASDIHLEATRSGLLVRYRLDGVLMPTQEPPTVLQHAVISRIKLLAELDIAERRKPQDGRVRVRLDEKEIDLRVSTVPTMFGESVVLRLLDHGSHRAQLDMLGMPPEVLNTMSAMTARPHGMLLVTGPTGSGKTTTLYAALHHRDASKEKIITVEDPIEYHVPGVTQVPVHRQAGVTFAAALRAILRQDPDVVMIGETRDRETAEIAVQAAMTGHFVFSTLHTNDAVSAIPRLIDLGIPPYLLAGTVDGVLAQRLVRVICDACRASYMPDATYLSLFERSGYDSRTLTFTRGAGCERCRGSGFKGRMGVFELLQVDDTVRDGIMQYESRGNFYALAKRTGMRSMRDDGWEKVRQGITTIEEVVRVT